MISRYPRTIAPTPHKTCMAFMALTLSTHAGAQPASVPAFDRPGIGIGTDTVPQGGLVIEAGLPTYLRDTARDGVRTRSLSTDVRFRLGLSSAWELQVDTSPWQRQRISLTEPQVARGAGDTTAGVKWAHTGRYGSLAVLGAATVAKGEQALTDGRTYSLAASYQRAINDRWTRALYLSHERGRGSYSTVWSPSLSVALNEGWGSYIELGLIQTRNAPRQRTAGAGLTWAPSPAVQLDASFSAGLTADTPDLQLGTGISIYFP